MTPELYVTLAVPVIGLIATIVASVRKSGRGRRDFIEQDQRILEKLDTSSGAAKSLTSSIESRVEVIASTAAGTRDPVGIVVACVLLVAAAVAAVWAFVRADGWSLPLWAVAALFVVFGSVGLAQDAVPRERDERGRPIR